MYIKYVCTRWEHTPPYNQPLRCTCTHNAMVFGPPPSKGVKVTVVGAIGWTSRWRLRKKSRTTRSRRHRVKHNANVTSNWIHNCHSYTNIIYSRAPLRRRISSRYLRVYSHIQYSHIYRTCMYVLSLRNIIYTLIRLDKTQVVSRHFF